MRRTCDASKSKLEVDGRGGSALDLLLDPKSSHKVGPSRLEVRQQELSGNKRY